MNSTVMPRAESFAASRRPSPGGRDSVTMALTRGASASNTAKTVELRLWVMMVLPVPIRLTAFAAALDKASFDS